jgi:hypothetical protein
MPSGYSRSSVAPLASEADPLFPLAAAFWLAARIRRVIFACCPAAARRTLAGTLPWRRAVAPGRRGFIAMSRNRALVISTCLGRRGDGIATIPQPAGRGDGHRRNHQGRTPGKSRFLKTGHDRGRRFPHSGAGSIEGAPPTGG